MTDNRMELSKHADSEGSWGRGVSSFFIWRCQWQADK